MSQTIVGTTALTAYHEAIKRKLIQPAYVIDEDTLDFSLTSGGDSLTPIENRLYLALNGTYINQLFRYNGSSYVSVSGDSSGNFTLAYIVGSTALANDWLSETSGGDALTPNTSTIYVIATSGDYLNKAYRYNGSNYVEISATGTITNYTLGYIVGSIAFASNWLSATSGGTALTPDSSTLYIVATSGDYENKVYRYDGSNYVEVSASEASANFTLAYIVGSTALASDWLSTTASGTALTPDTETLYIIATSGDYINKVYRYDGSNYVEVSEDTDTNFVLAYIVGSTELASDWLSKTSSGSALTPETDKLYIIASSGDYLNRIYRYTGSAYVLVGGTDSESPIVFAYVVGSTEYASNWLSETSGGSALTPDSEKIYIVISSGDYLDKIYRYTGSAYEEIGAGDENTNYKLAYIVGSTPLASDWLSETVSGSALTPDSDTLYIIGTNGDYLNTIYRYNGSTYVAVGGSGTTPNYTLAYIVGTTALASDWLSYTESGVAFSPDEETLYIIATSGDYYNKVYRFDETEETYEEVSPTSSAGGSLGVYIVSGSTALSSEWFTETEGGTDALTPEKNVLYIVLESGTYYNYIYRWDETNETYVCISTPNNTLEVFTGATSSTAGKSGAVPAPAAGDQAKVLLGNGTWSNVPEMTGATSSAAGTSGSVPAPEATDISKALFGDGSWHTVYTSAAGSTVLITTSIEELYGQTVSITDGLTTLTGTIDSSGECMLTDVVMYGTVNATATDTNNNEAVGYATFSYFGTYIINLTEDFSTVTVTTTDTNLYGQTFDIYLNGTVVSSATFSSSGSVTFYADTIGTYTLKTTVDSKIAYTTVSVLELYTTYTASMVLAEVYAFYIDTTDSDPSTCVHAYTDCPYGCMNADYASAYTDQDSTSDTYGQLIYGSWTGNEFFWPKPCMLKYTGVRDYYLDPDDYSLREDGTTASDYNNMSYEGNVMIEFPTVYFKRYTSGDYNYCIISSKALDSSFHAYAHHDINGNVLPYIYMAAYSSSFDGTRFRSISGIGNTSSLSSGYLAHYTTAQQEIDYCAANNDNVTGEGWTPTHTADAEMINDLLLLITMRTDTDVSIGRGNDSLGSNTFLTSGYGDTSKTISLDKKGLFYGITSDGVHGLKVFGIENWWGQIWHREIGWINLSNVQYRKMTYGTEDGSTVTGYNLTGSGYVNMGVSFSGSNGGYINGWDYSEYGLVPYSASGSSTTYLCDGLWWSSGTMVALRGGTSIDGVRVGAFCSYLDDPASDSSWAVAAFLSYKGTA